MIETAQRLERAEMGLRKISCDLLVAAPSSTAIYETVMELAILGKAIRERIQRELREAEGEAEMCIGAGI